MKNGSPTKFEETDSATTAQDPKEDQLKDTLEEIKNKENYILEKFLSDATSMNQEDKEESPSTNVITFIKPPVPLPRKVIQKFSSDDSSSNSNLTYTISAPKISNTKLLDDIDRFSFSSASTFMRKSSKESLLPGTPNEMYDDGPKHQVSTVGDIIIHNTSRSSKRKVSIVEQKLSRKIPEKIDVSKLQLCEIQEIIDNKYREIEKRRNPVSSSNNEDSVISRNDEDDDTSSTSKMQSQTISFGGMKPYYYEHLIGVVVYRCDKLLLSSHVNHPCVKVHIVDSVTGKYLQRSKCNEEQAIDLTTANVYPLITKAFNMQERRFGYILYNQSLSFYF